MKQLVSLIRDNYIHYAIVDDDAGELVPFADIMLPNPDTFGLHEAALLGTNLLAAVGLNGVRLPLQPPVPELPAAKPAAVRTAAPRRKPREATNRVQRYVDGAEIVAVVADHPEGITAKQIAAQLWHDDGPVPVWLRKTVENRINNMNHQARVGREIPVRIAHRTKLSKTGLPTQLQERVIYPIGGES